MTRSQRALLSLVLFFSVALPFGLALFISPIGTGIDEVAHIDRTFFQFLRPGQEIHTEEGLTTPGRAPMLQGHQAPLSYWLGAKLLSIVLPASEVGGIIEYEAGMTYSSESIFLGGLNPCTVWNNPDKDDRASKKIRAGIYALRLLNALYFAISIAASFLAARWLFPGRPRIALSAAFLQAGIPTAIWRSQFINNDNLVSALCSVTIALCIFLLSRAKGRTFLYWTITAAVLAGLAFLSKYNAGAMIALPCLLPFLRPDLSWKRRFVSAGSAAAVFLIIVLPRLARNLQIDGDLLSLTPMLRSCWSLYHPSSFFAVLFDPFYVSTLFERFWLEFHNLGLLDLGFPLELFLGWKYLLYAASVGLVILLLRRETAWELRKGLFLNWLSIVLAILSLVQMGTTFPMPGGRYFHVIIGPLCLLIAAGVSSLLVLLRLGREDRFLLLFSFCFFAFGSLFTAHYLESRLASCNHLPVTAVRAGVEPIATDLDGDGEDELYFWRRVEDRLFIAKKSGTSYEMKPEWSRIVAVPGDEVLAGDVNGDGNAELMVFHPAPSTWTVVDGRQIVNFHPKYSKYSDRAIHPAPVKAASFYDSRAFLSPSGSQPGSDLITFSPSKGRWHLFRFRPIQRWWRLAPSWTRKVHAIKRTVPFLLHSPAELLLGNYQPETGLVSLFDVEGKKAGAALIKPGQKSLLTADVERSGTDSLLLWNPGDRCISIHSGPWNEPLAERLSAGGRTLCLDDTLPPLSRHSAVFPIHSKVPGPATFGIFDRRTGLLKIAKIHSAAGALTLKLESEFDPGFYGAANRNQQFLDATG